MPKPQETYARALSLCKHADMNFLELARCLAKLHDNRDLWSRFLAKSGVKQRKALYLVKVHQRLGPLKLSKSRVQRIGWTKASIIAGHINPSNAEELLIMAESRTAQQLKAKFRGDPVETTEHCMTLYFSPDQYAELEHALIANGASRSRRGRGLENKEMAIMALVRKV